MTEILLFLCAIILPLAGPGKRKAPKFKYNPENQTFSSYKVNEAGMLEQTGKQ